MDIFGDEFDRNFDPSDRKFRPKEKRVHLKSKKKSKEILFDGIVFAAMGKHCLIEAIDSKNIFIDCTYGATLQSSHGDSSIISVGDRVSYMLQKNKTHDNLDSGKIISVGERFSRLSRKANDNLNEQVMASNVDYLIIAVSAAEPFYNKRLIDRMLIAAEQGNLTPVICVNKIDLMDKKFILKDLEVYKSLNIDIFTISTKNGTGFKKFTEFLLDKKSVLCGPSGVGKSSILNKMLGDDHQIVNLISQRTSKGQHTTSFAKMFNLGSHGLLVDTPGIREFFPWGIGREELPFFYHEFDEYLRDCKYLPCSHTHEPDCKVLEAVESGKINLERYQSYLNVFESLED